MNHLPPFGRSATALFASTVLLAACGGGNRPGNAPPTISQIANQSVDQDTATLPLAFTISDHETPADMLQVTLTTSDPAVVPLGGIALSGTGGGRSVTVTPASGATGTATVSLNVIDGNGLQTVSSFTVTVNPVLAQFSTLTQTLFAADVNSDPKRVDNITFTFDSNDNESAYDALFQ